ncbi:MAG: hypothetical protein KA955_11270 [Prevotella sp.]|nr:hypothetical protein [Prevotella sp.]
MKITLIKEDRSEKTFARIMPEEIVRIIHNEDYETQLHELREMFPLLKAHNGGSRISYSNMNYTKHIPHICFAAEYEKRDGISNMRQYNGLVLLEINNLPSYEDACSIRKAAAGLPYTYITFVGASMRSVKIVCGARSADDVLPNDINKAAKIQLNAYKRLNYLYSSQLDITVDNIQPTLQTECLMSADKGIYFNPEFDPIVVSDNDIKIPTYRKVQNTDYSDSLLPGMNQQSTNQHIFHHCMADALEDAAIEEGDIPTEKVLNLLAKYCNESGLPLEFAVKMTNYKPEFCKDEQLVRQIFDEAYFKKLTGVIPFKHIKKSTLLAYKMEAFMNTHYELRKNVMTGVPQYRYRDGFNYEFVDLTDEVCNSMTIRALKAGLDSWDKDMNRYINSVDIAQYDPVNDYLSGLPEWDGADRITAIAERVPTTNEDWAKNFHVWMRAMVAHWMGKDILHGNAYVPLLIGNQGCGKSSFCSILLPPELRNYYNDKIDFKNDTALNLGLTSFALINIDEFDSLSRSQQPLLKYLLTKSDVKIRPPYGKAYENRRRYASFIGTTNNHQPLTDPSGSRRFICVEIVDGESIDFRTHIDYEQVYAQLKYEINDGDKYWFDDKETELIMNRNARFQHISDLGQMISSIIRRPLADETPEKMMVEDIADLLEDRFDSFIRIKSTNRDIGKYLRSHGYAHRKSEGMSSYYVMNR